MARIADARLPCKLGHTTVYAPTVRALCVTREGWLGRADAYTAEVILDELLAALDRREADVILFRQLEQDSVLHRAALARATFATRRQHAARTDVRWQIELQPTLDEYLASVSSSTRKTARRTSGKLERDFGARLSIEVFREGSDLDTFLGRRRDRRVAHIPAPAGCGLRRSRPAASASEGAGQRTAGSGATSCAWTGSRSRSSWASCTAAGSTRWPGRTTRTTVTTRRRVPAAQGDRGSRSRAISLFDFGFGDAEYKSKLGHRRFEEGDVVIYARRLRPIWIKFARTALLEISRAVTTGLTRLALMERIKQWSRRPAGRG